MKKLLLLVTFALIAPARMQAAEIKRSVSAAQEGPLSSETLKNAITNNDIPTVQAWINTPGFITSPAGTAYFVFAVWKGKPDIIKLYLDNGFPINQPIAQPITHDAFIDSWNSMQQNYTPLMHAAFYAELPIVQLLLERGADTTITDKQGETAADITADEDTRNLIMKHYAAGIRKIGKEVGQQANLIRVRAGEGLPEEKKPAEFEPNIMNIIADFFEPE